VSDNACFIMPQLSNHTLNFTNTNSLSSSHCLFPFKFLETRVFRFLRGNPRALREVSRQEPGLALEKDQG
jgi:hypothetical protein